MENLGYYNGKFGPLEEMMVPMNDRVCYFGDGVYDATYTALSSLLTSTSTVSSTARDCSASSFPAQRMR